MISRSLWFVGVGLAIGLAAATQPSGTGQLEYNQHIPGNVAIPDGLKSVIMQYYPPDYVNGIAKGYIDCDGNFPVQDDLTNGRIQCWEQELSANGPDIYVVTYSRCGATYSTRLRIFSKDSAGAFHYLWGANPDVDAGTVWDPHFEDVERSGVKDILLYWKDESFNTAAITTSGVLVLAYRSGAIVPITPYNPQNGSVYVLGPPAPGMKDDSTCTCSDTDVGFVDIDGDGIPELLVYPDYGEDPNDMSKSMASGDWQNRWLGGTEVWKLVNGFYKFQYETPIGTTTPSGGVVGAAIKPASIPLGELQGAGSAPSAADTKGKGGGSDQAITLYVMPPSGFTLSDVDWASLRIADFTQASTADEGTAPAPYNATSPPAAMMPVSRFGQAMLQEDLSKPDMNFTQQDKDPVYYIGPSGRLHFTTPYHQFGFSKSLLMPWLYQQWQNGASSSPLTTCVSPGAGSAPATAGTATKGTPVAGQKAGEKAQPESQGTQHCFTPITIPIRVNLTGNRGAALGEARIWVDTGAPASSATKEASQKSAR